MFDFTKYFVHYDRKQNRPVVRDTYFERLKI